MFVYSSFLYKFSKMVLAAQGLAESKLHLEISFLCEIKKVSI